ncbi:MAG: hypothetical protein JW883_00765 [Deltaproteobacteria bacterium]|nr:hypothetical protein [Deltaproteobacteria bacterium]
MALIKGLELAAKEAGLYLQLKKKSPSAADLFLKDIRKRRETEKERSANIVELCRQEVSDLSKGLPDNRGVHAFSMGCLDGYFHLGEYLADGRAFLWKDSVLITPSRTGGYRFFVYKCDRQDLDVLKQFQRLGVIYSLVQIPGLEKETKSREIAYDLEKVFDPASYSDTYKRKKRIRLPFVYLEKNSITMEPVSEANLAECRALHDKWVEFKLSDEKTYQIMFPRARYYYCTKKVIDGFPPPISDHLCYEGFTFRAGGGELAAVNIMSIEHGQAFGLAMYGKTWEQEYSRLMGATDLWYWKKFLDEGIKYYNAGMTVNSTHKAFKTHYPYFVVEFFAYSRIQD